MEIAKTRNRRIALTIAFLAVLLIPFMPMAYAKNPTSTGAISLNVTGNAVPIGKGKTTGSPLSATLTLTGSAYSEGNGNQIKFFNLTGSLQIGPKHNSHRNANNNPVLEPHYDN